MAFSKLVLCALLVAACQTTYALRSSLASEGSDGTAAEIGSSTSRKLQSTAPSPATAPVPAPAPSKTAPGPIVVKGATQFAAFGNAVNPSNNFDGNTDTGGKNKATGNQCNIFSSSTSVTCDAADRPVPGCCSSTSGSAVCDTFDNGGKVSCSLANQPYPACCQDRTQPRSVCTTTNSAGFCGNDYPVPSCCDSTQCQVYLGGGSVVCNTGFVARCCPS